MIKDNSILKTLAMSIEDGALYRWFDGNTGTGDIEAMLTLLKRYWSAVASVFPVAFEESPRRSRLVHGVGVVALGCLMDEITFELATDIPTAAEFERELMMVAPSCAWTTGVWQFAPGDERRWNELQNVPRDIKLLTDHLLRCYRDARTASGLRTR